MENGIFIMFEDGPVVGPFCAMVLDKPVTIFIGAEGTRYELDEEECVFNGVAYSGYKVLEGLPKDLAGRLWHKPQFAPKEKPVSADRCAAMLCLFCDS